MKRLAVPVGLIVVADEPALFFSSISAAEGYLEAIDVDEGVYPLAYDIKGKLYRIRSNGDSVIIEPDMETEPCPDDLKRLLVNVLSARGIQVSDDMPLDTLLDLSARYTDDW